MRNTNLQKSSQWNTFNFGKVKNFTWWPRGIVTEECCRFSDNSTWQHSTVVKRSFTLVELMIVIAILAILAIIVIFSLNPGMLFNRFRDNNRVSDVNTLFKAVQYRSVWDDSGTSFKGDSTKVYISLPDVNPDCSTYVNLPEIPSGLTYACATEENLRKTDGTGWVPINFTDNNNPINILPVDPINTENNYLSYYFNGNDFAIQAIMQTTTNPNALEDGNSQTYTKKSDRYANVPIPNEDMYPVVFVSKVSMVDRFEASNNGSNIPQSKPLQTPWTSGNPGGNATWVLAKQKCQDAKKKLISMNEWGSIAIQSKNNSTIPGGNNYTICNATCGTAGLDFLGDRDTDNANSQTCVQDTAVYNWNCGGCTGNPRCQTGSGAGVGFDKNANTSAWTHNKKDDGIWDMNGNVWEWSDFEGEYGYITNGLWWAKDQNKDGKLDQGDEVYVIMPANGHMCTTLTTNQLDNLIADDNDNNRCQGGAAAWITTVSGAEPYTVTVNNMIGDIDQFRDGDGVNYGTGKYYFSTSPIYLGTGSENTATLYECTSFDFATKTFSTCSKYSTLGTYGDNRAPTTNDIIVSIVNRADKFGNTNDYYFHGYFPNLRTETVLVNMAIPASISNISNYNNDYFYIRAIGARAALRGGNWDSSSSAGGFDLHLNDTPSNAGWGVGFRCSSN